MCKYKEYGNCDEETKDQEYCIFHKPNKNEEEAKEFYKKFLKKFKPRDEETEVEGFGRIKRFVFENDVDCRGYVFPEIPEGFDFSFEYSVFEGLAKFNGATFEEYATFTGAIFKGGACFRDATFNGIAFFLEAKFERNADFSGTKFKYADFLRVTFERSADFGWAAFEGGACFRDATFNGIEFIFLKAKFEEYADFRRAKFEEYADFRRAKFERNADFLRSTFKRDANFRDATFNGIAFFLEAKFERNADFLRVTFERSADFSGATFKGDADFSGATFKGDADFREKKEDSEYKFYGELSFSNAEFRRGVYIDIPSEWFRLPQAEAEACRIQRVSYGREGRKDDADRMFVRERRALRKWRVRKEKESLRLLKEVEDKDKLIEKLRKLRGDDLADKLGDWLLEDGESARRKLKLELLYRRVKAHVSSLTEWLLADITCEYGTNWKRPVLIWLFVVLVLFPPSYWLTRSILNANDLWSYFYFSIVTATTLGYGDLHPVGVGRALASAEAVFGAFMWAVFLVVFARKYMR